MTRVQPSPEIWHRDDFPLLCNWRKLYKAVEVGVDRGEYAQMFLSRWMGSEWWGVDEYAPYNEMNFDRHFDYSAAVHRLLPYARLAKLVRESSVKFATKIPDGDIDFVYIDADHSYPAVHADIEAWWPKLSNKGIMAGHDWTDYPHHQGVKQAVLEWAAKLDLKVYITTVAGYNREECPSWYIYKTGMPGADWRRC